MITMMIMIVMVIMVAMVMAKLMVMVMERRRMFLTFNLRLEEGVWAGGQGCPILDHRF